MSVVSITSIDLKSIEDRLGRRLTRQEVARLRELADGAEGRVMSNLGFMSALIAYRQFDPARVSLRWGTA